MSAAWCGRCSSPGRSRNGRARRSPTREGRCSSVTRQTSSIRSRARASTARCAARSSRRTRSRRCSRTEGPGGARRSPPTARRPPAAPPTRPPWRRAGRRGGPRPAPPAAPRRFRRPAARHARGAADGDPLRAERARRRPGAHLAPVRLGGPGPLRRHQLPGEPARHRRPGRRAGEHRVREAGRGAGWRPHHLLRARHGRQRHRPAAPALLPRRLREPAGRMIDAELLDDPHAEPAAVRAQLADIARLNRLFGGTRAVVDALEPFFKRAGTREALKDSLTVAGGRERERGWTLVDVGTGGGDIPCAAAACARRYGIALSLVGIERIPAAARLARAAGLTAVLADGGAPPLGPRTVDVVIASQVLHHLPRELAVRGSS